MTALMTPSELNPMDLLGSLVLEDGRRWAEAATDGQRDDAAAIFDSMPDSRRMHFQTRPRGGSKTTDGGGVGLVALLTQAPPRSVSHAYARDADQAQLLVTAMIGLAQRSGLSGLFDIGAWGVAVKASGAKLVIESADAASAYGHIPFLVFADELAQWPGTRGSRALWEGIVSGLPKRRDSRLVVLTTAGDPAHWSASVLAAAKTSPRWRVSEMPGPLPWADPNDLAEQRRLLPASSYARLHLNQWTAAEDRLVNPDDLAACITHSGPILPDARLSYVIGLDLGLKNDRTVMSVCHADKNTPTGATRVVLDRMVVLAGTKDKAVQLGDVEALVLEAARAYRSSVRTDPWQAVGLAQRLRNHGLKVEEWSFTAASVGRLAVNLHLLLREQRLALPDDPDLLDELANVRLRETNPGVFRLDHDSGKHDDRAVSLGLAALALTEKPDYSGMGLITNPSRSGRSVVRTLRDQRPSLARHLAVRTAARQTPRGLPGGAIVRAPGALDNSKRRR